MKRERVGHTLFRFGYLNPMKRGRMIQDTDVDHHVALEGDPSSVKHSWLVNGQAIKLETSIHCLLFNENLKYIPKRYSPSANLPISQAYTT